MERKKFRTRTSAAKFAKAFKLKAKPGQACKMADGTKGRWYSFTKTKKAKAKKK